MMIKKMKTRGPMGLQLEVGPQRGPLTSSPAIFYIFTHSWSLLTKRRGETTWYSKRKQTLQIILKFQTLIL